MTHRTEANPPTPIEQATFDVLQSLSVAIIQAHKARNVESLQRMTEPQFRRILALYFHDKSIADWCRDLGIPDATDPHDTARS